MQSRSCGNSLPICIGTGSYKGAYLSRTPRRTAGDYLVLAKTYSLPSELRGAHLFFLLAKTHIRKVAIGATPPYQGGKGDYLVLAKMPSRKEIVPNSLRLPYFGACPAELRGDSLIFSRKDAKAQRNNSQFFAPSLLCELFFYFFLLAKTYRPVRCGRQAQRNYGLLGMTFRRGGLTLRLGVFA